MMSSQGTGRILVVNGPVIKAELPGAKLYELVFVGELGLFGEVVRVQGDDAFIQVYEDTTGIKPSEPVVRTGEMLSAWLGPGIIGQVYDGVQRPLKVIFDQTGHPFIARGINYDKAPPLDFSKKWRWIPRVKVGDKVNVGSILGVVPETQLIEHRILYPPLYKPGVIKYIAPEGNYTLNDDIAEVETDDGLIKVKMWHKWPVRRPRPFQEKLPPSDPLITGIRVIDTVFPIAKGGAASIPGPFGSGKTVTIRSLMLYAMTQYSVPVLCGERGNEAADALQGLLKLSDPATGRPLLERETIIVNTSNMPVAAREASIYMGATIAEYFRDQGYDVLLMADSTSRWAEAMREVALRIGEMPSEEGFPAYLPTRLAEFYERAGKVKLLNGGLGSLTIAASVSPPGGDFTEPVTSHTLRFIGAFWPLDARLAYSRHYPAINWLQGFSRYVDSVASWYSKAVGEDWVELRRIAIEVLTREAELSEIVRILGSEALSEQEKHILNVASMIREGFLKQDAFNPVDTPSAPEKQYWLLRLMITYYRVGSEAINAGVPANAIRELDSVRRLIRLKMEVKSSDYKVLADYEKKLIDDIRGLMAKFSK
ncbi:V-type ATP synthase subunit A [Caldivirga sp. UBA161]|uniref:V-type ATP synthase subunit A n=1 Tax=Caldivirga sp. UBA161 TaxID=1915569 RepID=UPI0025BDE2A8|nr:V-type ATP synthase subunit A [Caldivirga sp. UBA161]